MRYDVVAFDTGGTVVDWHGSLVDELARVPAWRGVAFDRHEFANAWRRGTMKGIVGQVQPAFNMDDVHCSHSTRPRRHSGFRRSTWIPGRTSGALGTVCVPGPMWRPRCSQCEREYRWSRSRCCLTLCEQVLSNS